MLLRLVFILCAILIGLIPGFFLIFNYLFSDSSGSIMERVMSFSVVLVIYGLLGLFFGTIRPKGTWHWGFWLNLGAFFVVLLYGIKEPGTIIIGLVYLTISLFAASTAAYYSSEYRSKRKR